MQILLVACTRSARLVEELSRNWESLLSLLSLLTPPSLPPLPTICQWWLGSRPDLDLGGLSNGCPALIGGDMLKISLTRVDCDMHYASAYNDMRTLTDG